MEFGVLTKISPNPSFSKRGTYPAPQFPPLKKGGLRGIFENDVAIYFFSSAVTERDAE
jgi:hypothetical protein